MKRILSMTLLLVFLSTATVRARVFLQISQNLSQKVPLVILLSESRTAFWEKFAAVLKQDLDYSGYFIIPELCFVLPENMEREKSLRVSSLLLTSSLVDRKISFTVEDPSDREILWNHDYPEQSEPRRFAHQVADDLVFKLTGKPGIASSKIAYVSDRTGNYQIYCIDADGENDRPLTDFPFMVHYPRWLGENNSLLLVSYEHGWPKLARFDLTSRKLSTFLAEPGLNACASVCPKTEEVAVVLSKSGNPEIYLFKEKDRTLKRLTENKCIDSSPAFAPDGQTLAFVSDRQGKPQIFLMDRNGFQVRRISYLSNYCTSPAWSPDGHFVAYVFSRSGSYGLAVYEVKSRETIIIDENLGAEDISWAPDSRHLVYTRVSTRPATLGVIDIITREKRQLIRGKFSCFSPSWSF